MEKLFSLLALKGFAWLSETYGICLFCLCTNFQIFSSSFAEKCFIVFKQLSSEWRGRT